MLDDRVVHVHRIFQVTLFGNFLKDIFIPSDDVVGTPGKGDVDHVLILEQLIGRHVDQARGLPGPVARRDHAQITRPEAPVDRLLQEPQRTPLDKLFLNHDR